MTREPEGQGDDCQGRIGKTAGGKNRATGDKEIRHAVHPALGIDHTVPGVVVHPGGAQEMMGAAELPGLEPMVSSTGTKVPIRAAASSSRKICCACRILRRSSSFQRQSTLIFR